MDMCEKGGEYVGTRINELKDWSESKVMSEKDVLMEIAKSLAVMADNSELIKKELSQIQSTLVMIGRRI